MAIVIAAAGAPALSDDVPQWRSDAARSGATAEIVPPDGMGLLWEGGLPGGDVYSSACVGGGRLYVGAANGRVYALSAADGTMLWSFETGRPIMATPAYWNGRLYVGSRDGHLYALHAQTGALLFDIFHGCDQVGSPLVAEGILCFSPGPPSTDVRAYDALTGEHLWSHDTGQISWSSPAYSGGRIFVGNNAGIWCALDAQTGAELWTYRTGNGVGFASAAVEGDVLVVCAGYRDRHLHVLDAPTGTLVKKVLVVPPGDAVAKAGIAVAAAPEAAAPESLVTAEELRMLLAMDATSRDAYLALLAERNEVDYGPLKDWLDVRCGGRPAEPRALAAASPAVNLSRPVRTSSAALAGGTAYITHRELSGVNADEYFTVAIDTSEAVPAESSVVWGTTPATQTLMDAAIVPSPSISAGLYAYGVHGTLLQARQAGDGTKAAEADFGRQVLGSPVPANGRIFLTGAGGKVAAYASGNAPPWGPTVFSPAGGTDVKGSKAPVLSWFGHGDADTPADALETELQIGVGYEARDLELSPEPPIVAAAGTTSYAMEKLPKNTHVFWRVRVRDPEGAYSPWSATQDFWVHRDKKLPDPPEDVIAVAADGAVILEWRASPSADVALYRVLWKDALAPWSDAVAEDVLGGVECTVGGL
ncbi:MAG: outer membrane protein assembly factor BamB family protein, partial [Planctomycetota bacterium]